MMASNTSLQRLTKIKGDEVSKMLGLDSQSINTKLIADMKNKHLLFTPLKI